MSMTFDFFARNAFQVIWCRKRKTQVMTGLFFKE